VAPDRALLSTTERRAVGPLGSGAVAIAAILAGNIVPPLGAVIVLLWAAFTKTPARELGLARPRSWPATIAVGTIAGVLLKLAMKAIVMPLLGAPPVNAAYHYLTGNAAALPPILYTVIVGGGFGEEVVYRGFLFERVRVFKADSTGTRIALLLLTSALFAAAHLAEQGVAGAEQAMATGLVFGVLYLRTRTLWMSIAAHAAFDVTAVALVYFDYENTVARWIVRS